MAVVTTAPVRDLPGRVSPEYLSFDEIVHGTGLAARIGLGKGLAPSVTLVPRRRIALPAHLSGLSGNRTLIGQVAYQFGNIVSTLAFCLFLFLAVGPHLFPYQTMTMLTGSMVPKIRPGDVAVDTRVSIYDLRPGDIISYHIPVEDNRVVSHRIVSTAVNPDGSVTVQTKGDANATNDPWAANFAGGTVWRVKTVVPKIGMGIRFFREPKVAAVSRYAAPALLVAIVLPAIWRPRKRRPDAPDPHDVQYQQSPFARGDLR